MSRNGLLGETRIQSVFHPSDFSEASEVAFAHALRIALVAKVPLDMLHVSSGGDQDWQDFPGVRETLERWGLLPPGSPKSAVLQLGIDVRKVLARGEDPTKACLTFLERHPSELIVLAVRQKDGRMRWLDKSVGEPIARRTGEMTLFLPEGVEGFVSREDGSVTLTDIVIPIAPKPSPQPAVEAASRVIRQLGLPAGTVTLLHVGPADEIPKLKLPRIEGWSWDRVSRDGEPAEAILRCASALPAGLVLMTTDGPDGFLDGLRGTTSERVLRQVRCPVGILPVGSMLG